MRVRADDAELTEPWSDIPLSSESFLTPQPHLRIASLAELLSACLSPAFALRVERNVVVGLRLDIEPDRPVRWWGDVGSGVDIRPEL